MNWDPFCNTHTKLRPPCVEKRFLVLNPKWILLYIEPPSYQIEAISITTTIAIDITITTVIKNTIIITITITMIISCRQAVLLLLSCGWCLGQECRPRALGLMDRTIRSLPQYSLELSSYIPIYKDNYLKYFFLTNQIFRDYLDWAEIQLILILGSNWTE